MKFEGMEVDIRPLLREMGVVGATNGSELVTHCPLHDDREPSFSMNIQTGLWICFSGCGQGNLFHLAQKMGYPRIQLNAKLMQGASMVDAEQLLKELLAEPEAPNPASYMIPDLGLFRKDVMPNWFMERGFTAEMIQRWGIRFDSGDGAVVIPAYDDYQKLVCIIKRYPKRMARLVGSKYKYTAGFQKSKHLFGMNRFWTEKPNVLVLVEGPLDSIWLWEHGWPALALLGATPSEWQIAWLKSQDVREVILAFDADAAGRQLTWGHPRDGDTPPIPGLAGAFGAFTSIITLPPGKKDVQECDGDTLKTIFENRQHFSLLSGAMVQGN